MKIVIKSNKSIKTYSFVKNYNYKVILEKDTISIKNLEELKEIMLKFGCHVEIFANKNFFTLILKD